LNMPRAGYELRVDNVPRTVPLPEVILHFNKLLKPARRQRIWYHLTLTPAKGSEDEHDGSGVISFRKKDDAKMLVFRLGMDPLYINGETIYFSILKHTVRQGAKATLPTRTSQRTRGRNSDILDVAQHEIRVDSVEFGTLSRDEETFSSEWKRTYTEASEPIACLKFEDRPEGEHPRSLQIHVIDEQLYTVR